MVRDAWCVVRGVRYVMRAGVMRDVFACVCLCGVHCVVKRGGFKKSNRVQILYPRHATGHRGTQTELAALGRINAAATRTTGTPTGPVEDSSSSSPID